MLVRLVVVVALAALCVAAQDPYQVLGLPRDASDAEIKKTFKKLARKHHPDALKGDHTPETREKARKKFMELSTAYETLSSKEKRAALDEGRRHSSVDHNYLRYNLFNDDFSGAQAKAVEIEKLMNGEMGSGIVFFWSPNYPDSIEAGLAYKKAAASLDITDISVFSFKCDDAPQTCHKNRLGDLPVMIVYTPGEAPARYSGKYEPHSMTEFALEKAHLGVPSRSISPDSFKMCPNPAKSIKDALSPYFFATMKRCTLGVINYDFMSFEHSRCYDCEVEAKLARGLLGRVMPGLVHYRLDCENWRHEDFCDDLELRTRDRAWTIASVQQRCWYAMKKPYEFSHEECEPVKYTKFESRYKAWDFVKFIFSHKKSHAVKLSPYDLPSIKNREAAFAIMYAQKGSDSDDALLRWSFLAKEMNTVKPVIGKKGYPLRLATIRCTSASECGVSVLPVVHLYGYGTKVKAKPPVEYSDLRSLRGLQRRLLHDVEPLHLHVLTPSTYKKKVEGGLKKGRNWLILYNAGEWCPPCNQIRPEWDTVARLIQDSPHAKKIAVGVVDCDAHGKLCRKLALENYPTMVFLAKGRSKVQFQGDRRADAIADWAVDLIDNRLLKISGQELFQRQRSGETMLVSFSAGAWCPPCTSLGPIFKKVANKLSDVNIPVVTINCDKERYVCEDYGIDGYPTIKLFTNGKQLAYSGDKKVGYICEWAKKMK